MFLTSTFVPNSLVLDIETLGSQLPSGALDSGMKGLSPIFGRR
jgi:hypothetical protein